MNAIANTFLLAGDKFLPEMHLRHPGYGKNDCGPFTKTKKRIKKFKETETKKLNIYLPNRTNQSLLST